MDILIEREIQKLVDENIGDKLRIGYILETLKNKGKLYDSDKKYLQKILLEHSELDEIRDRLEFLDFFETITNKENVKKVETRSVHFQEKWCARCQKSVFPERKFNVGAFVLLLFIGIVPGLLYYALTEKVCPICSKHNWDVPP